MCCLQSISVQARKEIEREEKVKAFWLRGRATARAQQTAAAVLGFSAAAAAVARVKQGTVEQGALILPHHCAAPST